ncbi:hypothetical protein H257_05909 [Aphanomyces astaci]|uniref:30S ribosomal protein S9 n=2 Tax=Aphanomyces astaci TaxID=112090 RepID=W4GNT2_APHAT|nr:hypothetical protein H257_05909 [Aphanomyces astaci]ETV81372.1 hypothetical protein H257_05909 [Aphanomyces astaci]KAF0750887.1 hypothetical protein AaE_006564 [Aphanomyces astaci]RHY04027.1 hypothetical protein DYB36_007430 [Aphanomyces astaci]RHY32153.1 hypothetical protein DYB25_013970 [Aphanomyces astaci]RHY42793.1 hypothetical protein DYB38_010394 [Aphanomyces astaci]|eukprot:XP_009829230.1 hypothetical protein H257_05909 [Aphanomyces astaci]
MLARAFSGLRLGVARQSVGLGSVSHAAGFASHKKNDDDDDDDESASKEDDGWFDEWGPRPEYDPDNWFGFKGDLDEVTEDGTATWIQAVRNMADIVTERDLLIKRKRQEELAKKKIIRVVEVDEFGRAYGTGRRKTSSARVWVKRNENDGHGTIRVNKMDLVDYFARDAHRHDILLPFLEIDHLGNFDVYCTVKGGGLSGQAGAIRHGISRALEKFNPDFRPALKGAGFLTRDSRMVESKKTGRKKARKSFQWVKR